MEKLSDLSSGHPEGPYKAKIQTQAMEHRVLDLDHQAGFLSCEGLAQEQTQFPRGPLTLL